MELTVRQERFKNNLLQGMDQTTAYENAGYKARGRSAEAAASRLLSNVKFRGEYEKANDMAAERAEVTRARILEEYAKIAFLDPRQFFDEDGNLIPVHDLDKDVSAALGGMDVVRKFYTSGTKDVIKKIKFLDKKGALDSLARIMGMFKDKVNVRLEAEVINAILAGLPEELRRDVIESINRHLSSGLT